MVDCTPKDVNAVVETELEDLLVCIDKTIAAIGVRLAAKQPIYEPDAEWIRLSQCADALRLAKRELRTG